MLQRIHRIVGRADGLHVVVLHQAAGVVIRGLEQGRTVVVDLAGGRRVEQLPDAERGLQLQVRPVVKRVAHGIRWRATCSGRPPARSSTGCRNGGSKLRTRE